MSDVHFPYHPLMAPEYFTAPPCRPGPSHPWVARWSPPSGHLWLGTSRGFPQTRPASRHLGSRVPPKMLFNEVFKFIVYGRLWKKQLKKVIIAVSAQVQTRFMDINNPTEKSQLRKFPKTIRESITIDGQELCSKAIQSKYLWTWQTLWLNYWDTRGVEFLHLLYYHSFAKSLSWSFLS